MAGQTTVRTATCVAREARDPRTGASVPLDELASRVSWLLDLTTMFAEQALAAHWDRESLRQISQGQTDAGTLLSPFPYKAYSQLWGSLPMPEGLHGNTRVVWMGQELAARELLAAGQRADLVDRFLAGPRNKKPASVSERGVARQVRRFERENGRRPTGFLELAPQPPTAPPVAPLCATGPQFARMAASEGNRELLLTLRLPHIPRPERRRDWGWVALRVPVPSRYRGGVLRWPNLRLVAGAVRVDLPVDLPVPREIGDPSRALGVDWGVRRLLTTAVVGAEPDGEAATDGRPLFFDPAGLLRKVQLLTFEQEAIERKLAQWQRLLTGRPDPALESRAKLAQEHADAVGARRRYLCREVARLAGRWVVEQALAASCGVIALEDLATMEHRDRGSAGNRRLALSLRGLVRQAIIEAAQLAGVRVVTVTASGTSTFCPRCDASVTHRAAPNGAAGYGWTSCPGCGHSADRDHAAAEKIGQRAVAPRRQVRRSMETRSVARRHSTKTRPTARRSSTEGLSRERRRAGRVVTSPPPVLPVGYRQVGPDSQGQRAQIRTETHPPSRAPLDGMLRTYRKRVRATPVTHRVLTPSFDVERAVVRPLR